MHGHRHDALELPLACLAHGRAVFAGYPAKANGIARRSTSSSAYVDQQPSSDLSKQRSAEFGFTIYPTIAETLRCGGDKLAVDAVLLIGEHGNYPVNEIGQKQYPRYELFQQIVDVFGKDGRATPVFNDKHLSWNFDWAKEMVETVAQRWAFRSSPARRCR